MNILYKDVEQKNVLFSKDKKIDNILEERSNHFRRLEKNELKMTQGNVIETKAKLFP